MKKDTKLSFQMQLTIPLLGCLLCSIMIIILCFILNIREAERKYESYFERLNEQWAAELNFMTAHTDNMRFIHLANGELMRIIQQDQKLLREDIRITNEYTMSHLLDTLCTIHSDVLRITVVTAFGDIFGNYVEDSQTCVALADAHMLYQTEAADNEMAVTDIYMGDINLVPYYLLTFRYPLYDVLSRKSLGMIYVDVDFGAMRERFDAVQKHDGWSSCILNGNGIIYAADPGLGASVHPEEYEDIRSLGQSKTGNGQLTLNGQSYVAHVEYLEQLDWYLVQCVERHSFLSNEMSGIYLLAFWVIVLLCSQIGVGTLLMKRVSAPIRELSQVMSQAAVDSRKELNYMACREDYPAEIHEIALGYNAMIDRIRENIIREYENELNQKRTELQMLQYQINPHFLYNTLNTMSAIARLHEIPYISDISESLSKIFFYNVKGGQLVTLQDELDNLQNYIRIQMIRFPGKFDVSYQIEQGLGSCQILKFLLQPLVENAVDHGIAEKRGTGQILIKARRCQGEDGEIVIQDDGAGISAERLERLRHMLDGTEERAIVKEYKSAIGLRNVNMRVRNYYGDAYGIALESEAGQGTKVWIRLPMKLDSLRGEGHDESNCSG